VWSGQGKILSFSRSRPGSPHKAHGSAFTLARVLATLVRGGSPTPLTRMNALPCQGRVYPCQSCQGRVKILLCPGETLPCEGKEFIHCQGRLGRTPSWLWWDFLVTNPPDRDRMRILDRLFGTRTKVSADCPPRQGPRHTVTLGHLGERPFLWPTVNRSL
jgi:hypothetical protein